MTQFIHYKRESKSSHINMLIVVNKRGFHKKISLTLIFLKQGAFYCQCRNIYNSRFRFALTIFVDFPEKYHGNPQDCQPQNWLLVDNPEVGNPEGSRFKSYKRLHPASPSSRGVLENYPRYSEEQIEKDRRSDSSKGEWSVQESL